MTPASALKELLDQEHERRVKAWVGYALLTLLAFGTCPPGDAICVLAGVLALAGVLHLIVVPLRAILQPDGWTIADLKYLALTMHFPEEAAKPCWKRSRKLKREAWQRFCADSGVPAPICEAPGVALR
jgi:hypothetical protein